MSDDFDDFFDTVSDVADPFSDGPSDLLEDKTSDTELSDIEKKKVLETWNNGVTSLKELIISACGPQYDGRSKKGMAVKRYLASRKLKPRAAQEYAKKTDSFVLTEEQKESIVANAGSMKPLEITRLIFNSPLLTNLSTEYRVVAAYYDTLDAKVRLVKEPVTAILDEYKPPKTEAQALFRVNKYVLDGMDAEKLTNRQKECLYKLIRFMHTYRYLFELNNYNKVKERELYESSFVRFVYDKPDLTEEEVDLYLNLCSDIVNTYRMQIELQQSLAMREALIEDGQKIPMTIVDEVTNIRTQIGDNVKRQKLTLNDLNGKRSERLKNKVQENASILNLVETWKDYDNRQRIIRLAELRKKEITEEIERLSTMDAVKFEIFGISRSEGTNS